jgi:hypothetical protein
MSDVNRQAGEIAYLHVSLETERDYRPAITRTFCKILYKSTSVKKIYGNSYVPTKKSLELEFKAPKFLHTISRQTKKNYTSVVADIPVR